MGIQLSNVGFTAQVAPRMKRAVATLSDGTAVAVVPDPNLTTQTGADDVTGTAKFRIYKSTSNTRLTWSLNATWTPATAPCSSTIGAVVSMVLDSSDNMHLVYQGTDNGLYYKYFPFSAGTWTTATAVQTVSASNAVTNRFRAVDIDVPNAGTSANVAIIVYESKASAGPSAWLRVYVRNNDGTTWRKAYEEDQASLSGGSVNIAANSEDVSISWGTTGITSNVGQLLMYACRIGVGSDRGDVVREIQYNTSTGTDGSATVLGTWPLFNQNVGGPYRRGWIFKTANNIWQVAIVAGLGAPKLSVMRLTHGAYGAPIINSTAPGWAILGQNVNVLYPQLAANVNSYNYIACTYSDNRVFFGFITQSTPSYISGASALTYSLAGFVFRYNDISVYSTSYQDLAVRPLDNYFTYGSQPVAIFGGANNRGQAGDFKFNFLGVYGYAGNVADGTKLNKAQYILDTFYDAPTITAPTYTVANDTPRLQVRVQNSALYPNIKGKIEFNLARDTVFSTDLRTIAEPDANYRYFGSTTGSAPPAIPVTLQLNGIGSQKLYSGTWYMRARVVSDLGQVSAWSATSSFKVLHQPAALPSYPQAGLLAEYGSGNITFSWGFSDTEPTDTQTAYQLLIQNAATGATVSDSGKVTSSAKSVVVNISSGNKDAPLQWSVCLWDTDDVQGPFSNPVLFTVGDSPAIALTTPVNGATVTSAAPSIAWNFTGGGTRTQRSFRVYISTLDILDTFARSAQVNQWGNSDNAQAWSNDAAANSDYSTDTTFGLHSNGAVATRHRSAVGSFVSDSQQHVTVKIPVVATGSYIEAGMIARRRDVNNYYWAGVRFGLTGAMTLFIAKRVGGVETDIATLAITPTYTANSVWDMRLYCIGNRLQIKVWSSAGQEQTFTYGLTATDTSIVQPGQCGVTSILNTGNTNTTPVIVYFDNYSKVDPDKNIVADSGWIPSTAATYTFPANILQNNSYYDVALQVMDTGGMISSTSSGVLTSWVHPALGDITVITDNFGATISWTAANIDGSFISWRVYRRYMVPALSDLDSEHTATSWTLIYETSDNVGPYSFKDYLIPLNKSVDYVIVQLADRFGSQIESNITAFSTVVMTANRYYFIPSVPVGTIASYEAANVTDDSWTDEVEQATLHVIGRGRQVQVGDDLGAIGTLTIQLRNPTGARGDREFLQRLASSKTVNVWMKNPFGDVKYIRLGNITVKFLQGTGQTEMSDLTVPYTEVFAPPTITRSA
jgi:hypothetical protein